MMHSEQIGNFEIGTFAKLLEGKIVADGMASIALMQVMFTKEIAYQLAVMNEREEKELLYKWQPRCTSRDSLVHVQCVLAAGHRGPHDDGVGLVWTKD